MCRLESAFTLGIFLVVACGCSGGSGSSADASAPTVTGGVTGQGGVSASGGATSSGGVAATGGTIPTGGTGGRTATGGATPTGGTAAGGGGGRTSTATGGTGTGTTTSTSGTGACNVPLCYNDLVSSCLPNGACVEQAGYMCGATACSQPLTSAPTSMFNYLCYGNSVTVSTTVDMTNPASQTSVQTYKKNGTVCYSIEMPLSAATANSVTMVIKNPAGVTVATYVVNQTARTATITCTGGSPAVISLDCMTSSSADGGTPCTTGTCTP